METYPASVAPQENLILRQVVAGFVAGFVAVLLFHQGMATILNAAHFGTIKEFPTGLTHPFGVPKIWSLAFWGGIWGIVFALIFFRFREGAGYWVGALVFGAIAPSLVAWLVVAPLHGQPAGHGWHAVGVITGLLVNGAWGIGTAWILRRMTQPLALR
jgi:hypothetical protein